MKFIIYTFKLLLLLLLISFQNINTTRSRYLHKNSLHKRRMHGNCVEVYEDINYKGKNQKMCGNVPDFTGLGWNDKMSSIKVPSGSIVELWEHTFYKGKTLKLKKDHPDFTKLGWNDIASSLKAYGVVGKKPPPLFNDCIKIYLNINYQGKSIKMCGQQPNLKTFGWDEHISSIKISPEYSVELFDQLDFKGKRLLISSNRPNFKESKFNDKVLSARVYSTPESVKAKKGIIPQGTYIIRAKNSDFCLDISGSSLKTGTSVQQWDCHLEKNQQWKITYKQASKSYFILDEQSNNALQVDHARKENGAKIITWIYSEYPHQFFELKEKSGAYYIISSDTKKCLSYEVEQKGASIVQVSYYSLILDGVQ